MYLSPPSLFALLAMQPVLYNVEYAIGCQVFLNVYDLCRVAKLTLKTGSES